MPAASPKTTFDKDLSVTSSIPEDVRIKQINDLPNIRFIEWESSYKNSYSKACVTCLIDGNKWSAVVISLVRGHGCPQCAGKRRWTEADRIYQINSIEGIEFSGWVDGYSGVRSRAMLRCLVDCNEWIASVDSIVNQGSGCPQCSKKRRWTSSDRVKQLNEMNNLSFVRWDGDYKNCYSKAIVRCEKCNCEWTSRITNLINNGHGCPSCAKSGYDQTKIGHLYALISDCGKYIKIGISNRPRRRFAKLSRSTPFKFNLVEQISGDGAKIAELEKYFHGKYERAGFTGFDGCTEWLVCTDELLKEIREMGR